MKSKFLNIFIFIFLFFSLVGCRQSSTGINRGDNTGQTNTLEITIGKNGNWYINGEDTGVKATGEKGEPGKDGHTPVITIQDGNWYIDGEDTGVKATGEKGESGKDGHTPEITIGKNGNRYIDGEDTGVKATGEKGEPGKDGKTPTIEISDDGYWVINGEKTDYRVDSDSWCSHEYSKVGIIGNACEYHNVIKRCNYCEKLVIEDEEPTKPHNYVNEVCTMCGDTIFSDGLEFELSDDETYYIISGIGSCNDLDLILPSVYKGLPVKKIDTDAFAYSQDIKSVVIPNNITTIDWGAFRCCYSLSNITLGRDIEEIDSYAFEECYALSNISVAANNQHFKTIEGNLYSKDGETFVKYAIGKTNESFAIPETVKIIGREAFSDCKSLNNVVIPNGLTKINGYAFVNCSNLSNVNIPDGVTHIGERAFENCINLEDVSLPESIEQLGYLAFSNCNKIRSIFVPKNVSSIYESFSSCDMLEEIVVDENNEYYKSIDGHLYTNDGETFLQYANGQTNHNFIIPDGVKKIGDDSFRECKNIRNITIPASVNEINDIFFRCVNIMSITVDENNEYFSSIDGNLYNKDATCLIKYPSGKATLNFEFPESVTSIESYAFSWANNIYGINIHENITNIGECAFIGSESVYINVAENNPNYKSESGHLYSKDGKILIHYSRPSETITIPENVEIIGVGAVASYQNLETLIIKKDIHIDMVAFYECTNLKTLILPKNFSVNFMAFDLCKSIETIYYNGTSEEWKEQYIFSGNKNLMLANVYYYSETKPIMDGYFWHYVNGIATKW